jgi:hypothetical protein
MTDRLAVYTTVFPAVRKFLKAWYESVLRQTDRSFDLFIGCDELSSAEVQTLLGGSVEATWHMAPHGSTPTQVREGAIREILRDGSYNSVVFVDADDVLHPTRVEAARREMARSDVAGCGLEIISEDGSSTGHYFGPSSSALDFDALLPRCNFFGMSNTVYKTSVLAHCLPLPAECAMMDWFLVTRAWAAGASLTFDPSRRMYYRQYSSNLAQVLPPFSALYIRRATAMVLVHYRMVLTGVPELPTSALHRLQQAQARVLLFERHVARNEPNLQYYVTALNSLPPSPMWWTCVARPELEEMWRS